MPSMLPAWRSRRRGQPVADGQPDVLGVEARDERRGRARGRPGSARSSAGCARACAAYVARVDLVDAAADRRQAAGDERLAQPLGRDRQVRRRRRTRRSSGRARSSARRRARAGCTRRRARSRRRGSGRGSRPAPAASAPGSAPTGVERPVPRWSSISTRKSGSARSSQPGLGGVARRARRLEARAALEEDQERPVAPVGVGDLAREHRDRARRRAARGRAGPRTRAR